MSQNYIKYPESNYIILSDGTVARLLKTTAIHRQKYYNLILNGKLIRKNTKDIQNLYGELARKQATENGLQS